MIQLLKKVVLSCLKFFFKLLGYQVSFVRSNAKEKEKPFKREIASKDENFDPKSIKKIVSVTPAGRKRYLEILVPYLLKNRHIINNHIFWVNTENLDDIDYMKSVCNDYPDFFKLQLAKIPINGNLSIGHFFQECQDEDTLYIRFDDDICFVDEDAVKALIDFRMEHPEYFLVFGNIINNSICSFLHQHLGNLPLDLSSIKYDCACDFGWKSPEMAEIIHNNFLSDLHKSELEKYKFEKWILHEYERFSINYFAWFGKDFKKFDGKVEYAEFSTTDEEQWLTVDKPRQLCQPNIVCGSSIVAHFAFFTQREYLEKNTQILQEYRVIAEGLN